MIMQRQTQTNDRNTKSVGYFLQVRIYNQFPKSRATGVCYSPFPFQCNGESESSAWSCHATADLRLVINWPIRPWCTIPGLSARNLKKKPLTKSWRLMSRIHKKTYLGKKTSTFYPKRHFFAQRSPKKSA